MSSFASALQILTVETTDSKTVDPATGKPFQRVAARCIVFKDESAKEVVTVGRLRVPKQFVELVKPGMFRAGFSLGVPDYGDNKGDVVAQLVSLQPVVPVQPSKP